MRDTVYSSNSTVYSNVGKMFTVHCSIVFLSQATSEIGVLEACYSICLLLFEHTQCPIVYGIVWTGVIQAYYVY